MTAASVAASAATVARQRIAKQAKDNAELTIARDLEGYTIECDVVGREKVVTVADDEGTLVAMFRTLSWTRAIAAARGWHGVPQ